MTELAARLDKNGLRVLCARTACGAELARIEARGEARHICVPSGWLHEGGAWRLSKEARDRLRMVRPLKPPPYVQPTFEGQGRPRPDGTLVDQLPAAAICCKCGVEMVLTAEALRAEPYPKRVGIERARRGYPRRAGVPLVRSLR